MNFFGLPSETNRPSAGVWIVPVPYEATVSFGRGTANGPSAIIAASISIEEYDVDTKLDLTVDPGMYTTEPIHLPVSSPADAMKELTAQALKTIAPGRLTCFLGGEHTITVGIVRAFMQKGEKPLIVHIDAHHDLRASYEGSPYSHACAMRPLAEAGLSIIQLGQRSTSHDDAQAMKEFSITLFHARDLANGFSATDADNLSGLIDGRDVYLTVDMDGFDPGLVPAVGTPEPGGITWWTYRKIIEVVISSAKRLLGMDVVELTGPLCDWRLSSAVTAAQVAYRTAVTAISSGIKSGPKK
jgi:agmatinase